MNIRRIHYISGMVLTLFIGVHLINHLYSVSGAERHIEVMNVLRAVYRNPVVETVLLMAVGTQIISGITLFRRRTWRTLHGFDRLHILTGFYLAFFLIIHVGAVLTGRWLLHLDTNFYFGAAGLNTFPLSLFFIPYYGLAIFSFFGHLASIHYKKTKSNFAGLTTYMQATTIVITGGLIAMAVLYGMTNRFKGVKIPAEYRITAER